MPFEAASVDLVTSNKVFHHVHKQRELLKEIARILKPGGVFVFRDMVSIGFTSQLCNDMMHSIYGIFDNGLSP